MTPSQLEMAYWIADHLIRGDRAAAHELWAIYSAHLEPYERVQVLTIIQRYAGKEMEREYNA
jgi:hypothetical protein